MSVAVNLDFVSGVTVNTNIRNNAVPIFFFRFLLPISIGYGNVLVMEFVVFACLGFGFGTFRNLLLVGGRLNGIRR